MAGNPRSKSSLCVHPLLWPGGWAGTACGGQSAQGPTHSLCPLVTTGWVLPTQGLSLRWLPPTCPGSDLWDGAYELSSSSLGWLRVCWLRAALSPLPKMTGQMPSGLVRALLEAAFCHPSIVGTLLWTESHTFPQNGGVGCGGLSRWHGSRVDFTMASPQVRDQGQAWPQQSEWDTASWTCLVSPPQASLLGGTCLVLHPEEQLGRDATAGSGGRGMMEELG